MNKFVVYKNSISLSFNTMSHTKAAISKARASATAFKRKKNKNPGAQTVKAFNEKPDDMRQCPWNQLVSASKNDAGIVTLSCPCGHKTQVRADSDYFFDGLTDHCDTHPDR